MSFDYMSCGAIGVECTQFVVFYIVAMPRIARAVAVGYPHHITQRGNYRQAVFESDEDYIRYLELLRLYCKKYSLKIWAYSLMGNHVHFIAVPIEPESLAKTFNTLHMRYAQYFNMKNKASGHLWQGRFYSCALDERHLYAGMRYVENNPVRARIVKRAEQYQWSSAGAHVERWCGRGEAVRLPPIPIPPDFFRKSSPVAIF